jgi:hypothetical protein
MEGTERDLFERSLRYATQAYTGAPLDAALEGLGWHDARALDARTAISLLFELQGEANVVSSAIDHVLAAALGRDTDPATAVVLPGVGQWQPPGELDGERLVVRGLGTASAADRPCLLVVASAGEKDVGFVVNAATLTRRPVRGLDPSLGLVEITGEAVATDALVADWRAAVTLGQLALAHELVGASRKMLEFARMHALERIQFDRPISMFQAVRHRLAESLIAIETADAVLGAAWLDGAPETAAMAKALAGRGARTVARHCQQVLAGIGFTTEHPLHRYVRRALVLDQLLGASRTLTNDLGAAVLRTRTLPPLLPL